MTEEAIYANFLDWFKNTWPMPETEELLPIVKTRFTPEAAELLTGVPPSTMKLEELAELKQMDPAELGPRLDELAKTGVVFRLEDEEGLRYKLNDALFILVRSSFWAGSTDDTTKALAPLVNNYYYNGFWDDWADVHHKGLRALPINETIPDMRQVLPYEDVVKVVDSREYYAVSTCPCKHRKNLDPAHPDCEHPDEVCLHFDELGRYTVENGLGRQITREETLEILQLSAKSGLVHGISNWQEGVDTICNCCKCCCLFLEEFHVLKHPTGFSPANYRAKGDAEKCKACGLCVKRCPMDAQTLQESDTADNRFGKISVVDDDNCIGCGVCVYTCPVEALWLERTEQTEDPPATVHEFATLYLTDRIAAEERRQKEAASKPGG